MVKFSLKDKIMPTRCDRARLLSLRVQHRNMSSEKSDLYEFVLGEDTKERNATIIYLARQ